MCMTFDMFKGGVSSSHCEAKNHRCARNIIALQGNESQALGKRNKIPFLLWGQSKILTFCYPRRQIFSLITTRRRQLGKIIVRYGSVTVPATSRSRMVDSCSHSAQRRPHSEARRECLPPLQLKWLRFGCGVERLHRISRLFNGSLHRGADHVQEA